MSKKVDRGEFFPYINGRYVNPYEFKAKERTHETDSNKRGFKKRIITNNRT